MRKGFFVSLVVATALLLAVPVLSSAAQKTATELGFSEGMSQGDFANLLVKVTNAEGFLPTSATLNDVFKFWEDMGVVPPGGWNTNGNISRDDLIAILGLKGDEAKDLSFDDLIKKIIEKLNAILNAKITPAQGNSVSPLGPTF
ncbi:MAG: hypothetical protein HY761_01435 [Candidatus Omnitrophica bacterium]|nr:hypothetical protein [Candidatus Omnitrophota bacterium]